MAKAKIVHNQNSCSIIFEGDRLNPEPETGVIKFPGGYVEVSRVKDGEYWAHLCVDESESIIDSRIDYNKTVKEILPIPYEKAIQRIAIKTKQL